MQHNYHLAIKSAKCNFNPQCNQIFNHFITLFKCLCQVGIVYFYILCPFQAKLCLILRQEFNPKLGKNDSNLATLRATRKSLNRIKSGQVQIIQNIFVLWGSKRLIKLENCSFGHLFCFYCVIFYVMIFLKLYFRTENSLF